jgi:hypothetical protein
MRTLETGTFLDVLLVFDNYIKNAEITYEGIQKIKREHGNRDSKRHISA